MLQREIKEAISYSLHDLFPDYHIEDEIPENIQEPCAIIRLTGNSEITTISKFKDYKFKARRVDITIIFIDSINDLDEILAQAVDGLRYIKNPTTKKIFILNDLNANKIPQEHSGEISCHINLSSLYEPDYERMLKLELETEVRNA